MEKMDSSESGQKSKQKMQKKFISLLLECNPIDPFSKWSRKLLNNIGLLDTYDEMYYWTGRRAIIKLFSQFWGYKREGSEFCPKYGGALLISNHQSEFDPFLIGSAINRKVRWVSKFENFDIPIFKSLITPFGTIPIKRGEGDKKAMDNVRDCLKSGDIIGIFPEGTRSPNGKIQPFRSGAARLCIETGVPFIPGAIFNAYKVFPKNTTVDKIKFFNAPKISVKIGNPVYIHPDLELTNQNVNRVKNIMYEDISSLMNRQINTAKVIYPNSIEIIPNLEDYNKRWVKDWIKSLSSMA